MNFTAVIFGFLFFSSILAQVDALKLKIKSTKSNCGKSQSIANGNSIGGNPARKNSFPWLAAFRFRPTNEFFCGGSLVSTKHVLSAAHCFQQKGEEKVKFAQEVLVLLGKHNLNDDDEEDSKAHAVNDLILHEDWDSEAAEYDADIAIIVLESKVHLKNFIAVVCLPAPSEAEVTGNGTVVGWGISERSIADGEDHDSKPNELQLPAVTRVQCLAASTELDSISSDRTFCAGFENQNKSVCKGDSGGGFYLYDSSKREMSVIGIVSSSLIDPYGVCRIDIYSIFTDVTKYVDWIEEKMEKTMKTRWTEVEFDCEENEWLLFECFHNFKGFITQNMKIRLSDKKAASTDGLKIYFSPSIYIFEGISDNFSGLKKLEISEQEIKFVERKNFKKLKNLEKLVLYRNQIEFLPDDVFLDLPNLNVLNLSYNLIKTLSLKIFNDLRKLEFIYLFNNKIEKLPRDLFSENLQTKEVWTYGNPWKEFNVDFSIVPDVKLYNESSYYYHRGEKLDWG